MVVIKARRLYRNFFIQDALTVAKSLIGKLMIRLIDDCEIVCRIVETEAYIGPEDKGCHAYGGRKTKRTEVMFEEGGITYVYLIYGMYYCINVVAGGKGKPEAALIRALEPLKGIDILKKNSSMLNMMGRGFHDDPLYFITCALGAWGAYKYLEGMGSPNGEKKD